MYKSYNNQKENASKINEFLKKVFPDIRKTQLNIIPYIVLGIINSESIVASDISKKLNNEFSLVKNSSVIKNYKKKHSDKIVHIVFDHMYSHDNYTIFMITMRIGKQGIPLWFRCFKGNNDSKAFKEDLLKSGIKYVSLLFDNDYDLYYLADRWFSSTSLLEYINSLGHTYIVRLKGNMKTIIYDNKKQKYIWISINELNHYVYKPIYYENYKLTKKKYLTNIVISKSYGTKEPWFLATNGDVRKAIKYYGYRFGAIECVFKSQKSNGFNLEKSCNASLKYFESMYTLACFSTLFLTILGTEYSKNYKCYKHVGIDTHTTINGKKIRILSLFNTGLQLFHLAYNSSVYIRIPYHFILYDI